MTRKKTPIQIFQQIAKNTRMIHIYMKKATGQEGGLPREEKGFGSLKHILWAARDHADHNYEQIAQETIALAMITREVADLRPVIKARGSDQLLEFVEGLEKQIPLNQLKIIQFAHGNIAINTGDLNLASIAFAQGADIYIVPQAGVLQAKRDLAFKESFLPPIPGNKPHSNLFMLEGRVPIDIIFLNEALEALIPNPERQSSFS